MHLFFDTASQKVLFLLANVSLDAHDKLTSVSQSQHKIFFLGHNTVPLAGWLVG